MLEGSRRARRPGGRTPRPWARRIRGWARACDRLLVLAPDALEEVPALLGVEPERLTWCPTASIPTSSTRRPAATRASPSGGSGSWRTRAAGARAASRAAWPTATRISPPSPATPPCSSTWAATPRSSAWGCWSAPTRGPASASTGARRSCSSAATRGSGRASTPPTRSRPRARATCSWPAGAATTSCRALWRRGRARPALGAGVLRPGARGGDGLWPAAHRGRPPRPGRPSWTTARPGWLVEPDDEARARRRPRAAVNDPVERARRGGRPTRRASATRGPSWPRPWRAAYERARRGRHGARPRAPAAPARRRDVPSGA